MSLQLLMFCLILCQICTSIDYEITKPKYRYYNRFKPGTILVKSHARKLKEAGNCDSNVLQPSYPVLRFMYNFVGEPSGKYKKPKPNSKTRKSKDPGASDYNEQYPNPIEPYGDLLNSLM